MAVANKKAVAKKKTVRKPKPVIKTDLGFVLEEGVSDRRKFLIKFDKGGKFELSTDDGEIDDFRFTGKTADEAESSISDLCGSAWKFILFSKDDQFKKAMDAIHSLRRQHQNK